MTIPPNKTDAGNGSYGICRVIDASRSPSPDPRRSRKKLRCISLKWRLARKIGYIHIPVQATTSSTDTRNSKNMNTEQKKAQIQREQTDQSLGRERHKTDDALATNQKHTQNMADDIVERARDQADEILDAAREKADKKLSPDKFRTGEDAAQVVAREVVAEERIEEDASLKQERASADESLRWEREEQSRILAALLPLERERTDRFLLTERGLADDSIVHRDDLMGMVSHDLQNLLAGIAIQATILAKQASDSDEGRRTLISVDRIERYVARMNRLIGDLIDVTSVDAGKFAVHPQPGDVAEMIAEAIAPFAQTAQEKGLSLGFATDGQILHGVFDWDRMVQVFTNLIANAIKFTHNGDSITIKIARAEKILRVSVLDTGEGIAEDMRDAIFVRFGQAGGSVQQGLGLGLYISKCIVEAQGGRIWAESNPAGNGSAFHLTIPAHDSANALHA